MKLTKLVMIVLLVAAFASGVGLFWNGLAGVASYGINTTDFAYFNATTEIEESINKSMQIINASDADEKPSSGLDIIGGVSSFLTNAGETAYMVFFEVPNMFMGIFTDMGVKAPFIPSWFWSIIQAILGITVIAAILHFMFGREV